MYGTHTAALASYRVISQRTFRNAQDRDEDDEWVPCVTLHGSASGVMLAEKQGFVAKLGQLNCLKALHYAMRFPLKNSIDRT